jgi:hypothetical protein
VLADEPLDRRELEALGLHLLDEPQALDVLGPVVARARADHRRGEEPAGLVVADVADRHAGLVGQLLDGQLALVLRLAHRAGCYLAPCALV